MQLSLFYDTLTIINSCSFLKKYDALFQAFDLINNQPDFSDLGRKGYPRSAYIKALIYKQSERIKHISDLIRDLKSRPILSDMCGFTGGNIPSDAQFSRFLSSNPNTGLEDLFHLSGKKLVENKIATLDIIMADSKPILANTKHNNPKNPSRKRFKKAKIKRNPKATYSYYSYSKQPFGEYKKEFTFFWGYRTHVLTSKEGIPLVEITLPNDQTDAKVAIKLLKKFKRIYGQQKGRIFLGDAGYDTNELYEFIVNELKSKPFIPLNPRNKQPEKELGKYGLPLCKANLEMKYCGISNKENQSRKKFRCPIKSSSKKMLKSLPSKCPVNNDKFCTGKTYGCTAYIDITDNARTQVPRESKFYKDTYNMRTTVERYFSALGPREVEEISQYKYRSVRNQMTIAHLTLSLTALAAAIILEQPNKIRCYKTFADTA